MKADDQTAREVADRNRPLNSAESGSGFGGAHCSARSYRVRVWIEYTTSPGEEMDIITMAYTAEDAVFQVRHSMRHWKHTIHGVEPNDQALRRRKDQDAND